MTWEHPQPPQPPPPPGNVAQQRIWRVRRAPTAPEDAELPVSVVWTTDVTAFYGRRLATDFAGMKLLAFEETSDGIGSHDEISMRMNIDGVAQLGNGWLHIEDFKEGESKYVDNDLARFTSPLGLFFGPPPRFKNTFTLQIGEEDSFSYQTSTFTQPALPRNIFGPNSAQRMPPDPGADWFPDGGEYRMPFLLSHGTQRVE